MLRIVLRVVCVVIFLALLVALGFWWWLRPRPVLSPVTYVETYDRLQSTAAPDIDADGLSPIAELHDLEVETRSKLDLLVQSMACPECTAGSEDAARVLSFVLTGSWGHRAHQDGALFIRAIRPEIDHALELRLYKNEAPINYYLQDADIALKRSTFCAPAVGYGRRFWQRLFLADLRVSAEEGDLDRVVHIASSMNWQADQMLRSVWFHTKNEAQFTKYRIVQHLVYLADEQLLTTEAITKLVSALHTPIRQTHGQEFFDSFEILHQLQLYANMQTLAKASRKRIVNSMFEFDRIPSEADVLWKQRSIRHRDVLIKIDSAYRQLSNDWRVPLGHTIPVKPFTTVERKTHFDGSVEYTRAGIGIHRKSLLNTIIHTHALLALLQIHGARTDTGRFPEMISDSLPQDFQCAPFHGAPYEYSVSENGSSIEFRIPSDEDRFIALWGSPEVHSGRAWRIAGWDIATSRDELNSEEADKALWGYIPFTHRP